MSRMEGSTMNKTLFRSLGWVIGVSLVLILGTGKTVQASGITDSLKTTIDQVLNVVIDPQYQNDRKSRRDKMKEIIFAKFNFLEMGKRSLGSKHWKARLPEERKSFINIFGKLLENSYASKLEGYSNQKINYVDEIIKGKYAMVKTEIVRKNDNISVDYKMIKTGSEWLVYDIVIEGVSMIKNYRSQFARIIHSDSFDTLMEKLNTKVDKLEAGEKDKI